MLDKSIPYVGIIMRRTAGSPLPDATLPPGYGFVYFKNGDEKDWARIETSVLEFDDEMDALLYFQKDFIAFLPETERRCLFIQNPEGEKVATGTAWWAYDGVKRVPLLHWIAVKPQYQDMGLGKAVSAQVLRLICEIEGDRDVYLSTQTWSHRAVAIYRQMGFQIVKEKTKIGHYENDKYEVAIDVLRSLGPRFSDL